jgi:hypothetical protein
MDDCEQISCEPMCDRPEYREWAKEEIVQHKQRASISGSHIGERYFHCTWPPDVYLAFLYAPIIKPAKGEIQRKLYG